MQKEDVITYFNNVASNWDEGLIRNESVIQKILNNAKVTTGKHILDVGCGTGVLIPDYVERNVASVTAIDIAPEMVKIAKEKFSIENVEIICGDVETVSFNKKFDCIVVYNAFPHFPEPKRLIDALVAQLQLGGTLTIAHGMSRKRIDAHHSGSASKVSIGLMSEEKLAALLEPKLEVITKISDEQMYQVVGVLKCG